MVGQIYHRCFQAGKAHVQRCAFHMGMGQGVDAAPGLLRQLVHRAAAGIGQSQHAGRLVKALPCRIVPCSAQNLQIRIVPDIHDQSVAAGDGQRQKGRFQLRESQIVCSNMPPDMVNRDQRDAQTIGHGLGKAQPHQHRTDQSRRIGDSHGVDILPGAVGVRQRLFRQGGDHLYVLPGGNFRHHAAV